MKGSIQAKRGIWYIVAYSKDEEGNKRQKWINTGLPVKGGKKAAKELLDSTLEELEKEAERTAMPNVKANDNSIRPEMLFGDFCEVYLIDRKPALSPQVYENYKNSYLAKIKTYFNKLNLRLIDVTTEDILAYYDTLKAKGLKNVSLKHFECILRPALRRAYREKLIPQNPYDFVPPIKRERPPVAFYNEEEMAKLFEVIKGHKLELVIKLAAFYGLRRSEVLGLRWSAVDFIHKTLSINHKMLMIYEKDIFFSDALKTQSSNRTMPLIPEVEQELIVHKQKIEANRKFYGKQYDQRFSEYICVDDKGKIIYPNYVTATFCDIIRNNGLKHIRFHDLRHSCASIMLKNGVQMKQIQDWLGHSNFATTANVYSHLDFSSKMQSASVIAGALQKKKETPIVSSENPLVESKNNTGSSEPHISLDVDNYYDYLLSNNSDSDSEM